MSGTKRRLANHGETMMAQQPVSAGSRVQNRAAVAMASAWSGGEPTESNVGPHDAKLVPADLDRLVTAEDSSRIDPLAAHRDPSIVVQWLHLG